MCRPNLQKRFFSRLMKSFDVESDRQYRDIKEELFQPVKGRVLEIGPGTGVNLPFYPGETSWVGLEPNSAMWQHIEKKAAKLGMEIKLYGGDDFWDDSALGTFDFVVSTLVLCSVDNVEYLLDRVLACLRPGGEFRFIEHVVDPDSWSRRAVQRVVPYSPWRYFSDGCNPGRDLESSIQGAGFSSVQCESFRTDGTGMISWINRPHIYGSAIK